MPGRLPPDPGLQSTQIGGKVRHPRLSAGAFIGVRQNNELYINPKKMRWCHSPEQSDEESRSSPGIAPGNENPAQSLGQGTGCFFFFFLFTFFFYRKLCLFLGFSSAFIFFPFVTHNNPSSLNYVLCATFPIIALKSSYVGGFGEHPQGP